MHRVLARLMAHITMERQPMLLMVMRIHCGMKITIIPEPEVRQDRLPLIQSGFRQVLEQKRMVTIK